MRKRKPRALGIAAVAVIPALLLAACSSGGGSDAKVSQLTIWESQSTPQAVKDVTAAYAKSSGIKMNVVTIPDDFETNTLTKWAARQRPDVLFYQPAPGQLSQLNAAKNLQNLNDMAFVSKTKFGLASSGQLGSVHYTATYGFPSVYGVYYNTAVFKKYGITVPTTAAQLEQDAATLKAKGVTPFAVSGGDSWTTQIPFVEGLTDLVANGDMTKVNSGAMKVTGSTFITAAGTLRDWAAKGWVNKDYKTALYADVPKKLQAGEVAMYPMASWMTSSFTDQTNIGFFGYPSSSGKVQWQSSNNASIQLPKTGNAAQEKASRAFLDYLTVGPGYTAMMTANKEPSIMTGVADPASVTPLAKAAATAFASNGEAGFDQLMQYGPSNRADLLASVLTGNLTPSAFTKQYQQGIDSLRKLHS